MNSIQNSALHVNKFKIEMKKLFFLALVMSLALPMFAQNVVCTGVQPVFVPLVQSQQNTAETRVIVLDAIPDNGTVQITTASGTYTVPYLFSFPAPRGNTRIHFDNSMIPEDCSSWITITP